MSVAERMAERMEYYCGDDTHGYSQVNRWGPDYDCSSLIYQICYDLELPLTHDGYRYTGAMVNDFSAIGFSVIKHTDGTGSLQRGDILLNVVNHTVMYLGNSLVGGARIDECGTTKGATSGDQTGREICVHDFYEYPWDYVLRAPASDEGSGDWSKLECDGIWGAATTRRVQTVFGCYCDGEVWHQWPENASRLLACTGASWCYDYSLAGSPCIRAMQNWLGVEADGLMGAQSIRALEARFGYEQDGVLDYPSLTVTALQKWLNDQL